MKMPTECARCGKSFKDSPMTMSFFNEDYICTDECVKRERNHPEYLAAHQAEVEQCMKGEYNFKGVGCPADLYINGKQPTENHEQI